MLEAAKRAGVTSAVCTPHCRDPYFDYDRMWDAYRLLASHAGGFPVRMGFEVYHRKLMELGLGWAERLCLDGGPEFLLEFSPRATAFEYREYERTVHGLRSLGLTVVVAHPERYPFVQRDPSYAERLVDAGCELQLSARCMAGAPWDAERRCARRLARAGLYAHVASDAHRAEHYAALPKALRLVNGAHL